MKIFKHLFTHINNYTLKCIFPINLGVQGAKPPDNEGRFCPPVRGGQVLPL